jgi:hypothetical protein
MRVSLLLYLVVMGILGLALLGLFFRIRFLLQYPVKGLSNHAHNRVGHWFLAFFGLLAFAVFFVVFVWIGRPLAVGLPR